MSSGYNTGAIVPERCDCKVGERIGNRYRVEAELGQGSFGCVYKVSDDAGRVWALKLLRLWEVPASIRQPLIERFDMEYTTGRISSRNLVHSADSGFLKGNPYIVMEFCDGGDLSQFISKPDAPICRYALEILNGLKDLHSNGKVHRDLKPENVLIKHDGTAVLTDFGISGDRNKRMTERNIFGKPYQIFGTYAYMPPEQVNRARGNSTVLPTTDLFSFGVMMYQLITGSLPFGPLENENDLVRYQRRGKAGEWDRSLLLSSPNGHLWENLISRCLVADLRDRIQSASEAMPMVPRYGDMSLKASVRHHTQTEEKKAEPGTWLQIMQGPEHGTRYQLDSLLAESGRKLLTVGREKNNDIALRDFVESYLSRHHFTIEHTDNTIWTIRDGQWNTDERMWIDSTNGTFVNSTQITRAGMLLHDGDIISAGDFKLKFINNLSY